MGQTVGVLGLGEGVYDGLARDTVVGADVQQVAGVVVQLGDDLGVGAVCQWPVGEVGLPALVG